MRSFFVATVLLLAWCASTSVLAQERQSVWPKWGDRGVLEYSGSATLYYASSTGKDAKFEVDLYPNIGWFVADGFQLGFGPIIGYSKQGDVDSTSLGVDVTPRYVFMRQSSIRPSVMLNAGFIHVSASQAGGSSVSETGILFGAGPAIAIPFGDRDGHGHLNLGLAYRMTRLTDSKTTTHRIGLEIGVSFWE